MSIKAIFFTVFDPEKGPVVLHQVPEGSVVPCNSQLPGTQQLFDFHGISKFIIPQQEFCDRLVTVCVKGYRIVGYPVCIQNRKLYSRNEFIFNFALVLEEDTEISMYASIVRKLARLLRNLEEQNGFLTKQIEADEMFDPEEEKSVDDKEDNVGLENDNIGVASPNKDKATVEQTESDPEESEPDISELDLNENDRNDALHASDEKIRDTVAASDEFEEDDDELHTDNTLAKGKIYALCEMILEDLNNYCECMIPIDESNTINLKLFPPRPPPAPVHAWHVPLSTVQLDALNVSSDLTLTRIIPFINGISSVGRIAQLADTDLGLTRKAIAHLLYYGCVILLDIFQFGAIYAPTAEIGEFVEDEEMQEEARRYVCVPRPPVPPSDHNSRPSSGQQRHTLPRRNAKKYLAEKLAASTQTEYKEIDGAALVNLYTSLTQGTTLKNWCLAHAFELRTIDVRRFVTFGIIKGFLYRVHKYAFATSVVMERINPGRRGSYLEDESIASGGRGKTHGRSRGNRDLEEFAGLPLARYLDGLHCFDEICTDVGLGDREVEQKIKRFGDGVELICR